MVEENGVSENTGLTMMKILKSAMFFSRFFLLCPRIRMQWWWRWAGSRKPGSNVHQPCPGWGPGCLSSKILWGTPAYRTRDNPIFYNPHQDYSHWGLISHIIIIGDYLHRDNPHQVESVTHCIDFSHCNMSCPVMLQWVFVFFVLVMLQWVFSLFFFCFLFWSKRSWWPSIRNIWIFSIKINFV